MTQRSASRWRAGFGHALTGAALLAAALAFVPFTDGDWAWNEEPIRLAWAIGGTLAFAAAWIAGAGIRRRAARGTARDDLPLQADGPLPVFHASQTGYAQWLAERTAQALREAGIAAQARALESLDAATLETLPRALFVASTTGEGDAPDPVAGFVRRVLGARAALSGLRYGLLALGDRHYQRYCAFGRRLDGWLADQGAERLFPRIEVDNADAVALEVWRHALGRLTGAATLPDWQPAPWQTWRLARRDHLNPGSLGEPTFHLELLPEVGPMPAWRAGDIAEILPQHGADAIAQWLVAAGLDGSSPIRNADGEQTLGARLSCCELPDPAQVRGWNAQQVAEALVELRGRDYSIASLPTDGHLDLLIRQGHRPDGSLGLGAGWLTAHLPVDGKVRLRLRSNPNFHAPAQDGPLILIGNGTGLAGLRALLHERIAQGRHANWLLFGERQRGCDFYHGAELEAALAAGQLAHLDLAFSRDQPQRRHVQHALAEQGERLKAWMDAGAVIQVCGSLSGMAGGVDAVLRGLLGDAQVQQLTEAGRYRRDVY